MNSNPSSCCCLISLGYSQTYTPVIIIGNERKKRKELSRLLRSTAARLVAKRGAGEREARLNYPKEVA